MSVEVCGWFAVSAGMREFISRTLAPENEWVMALGIVTWRTMDDPTTSTEGVEGVVGGLFGPSEGCEVLKRG